MESTIELDISALISALGSSPWLQRRGLWDPTGNTLQGDSYILVDDAFVACIQDVRVFRPFRSRIFRGDYITFQFMQSSGKYYHHFEGQIVTMGSGSVSLTAVPTSETESRGHLRPSTARGVAIHISRGHLLGSFGLRPEYWREEYRDAFLRKDGAALAISTPLTAEMWMILDAMIDCAFDEPVRSTYLRAKATELLTLAVIEFNGIDLPGSSAGLSSLVADQRRIDIAALIYRRELRRPPSVNELSQRVGMNRNKLTSGFRAMFGRTPAEYSREIRLDWAARRLSEGLSIRSAAAEAGYDSVAAFGRAFRENFGHAPSDLIRGA